MSAKAYRKSKKWWPFKERVKRELKIIIDEFGSTAGLVTLEDVLEQVVGEYADEFSTIPWQVKTEDKDEKIFIDPSIYLEDLEKIIQFSFPKGDYKTLTGLIYTHLDRIPEKGDTLQLQGCKIKVESMEKHRIVQVSFKRDMVEPVTASAEPDTAAGPAKKK